MTYNGRKYSGSTTVVVGDRMDKEEPANYSFKIYCNLNDLYNAYLIDSNIPGFNALNVTWSVTPADADWFTADGGAYVDSTITCTITASYVYNGRTYTDSMKQTAMRAEYTFGISLASRDVAAGRASFTINTNIPGCTNSNVTWTVVSDRRGGSLWDGQYYTVDEFGMTNGESYVLNASYVYDGRTYTASCTVTCTWGSDNADGHSLSGIHTDGWAGGSAASGFRTEIPDCTSAAVPAAPDRHSRNYAAQ